MTMPLPPGVTSIQGFGAHFSAGFGSGRGDLSPGLEAQGQKWTQLGQQSATRPSSVLSQLSPSPIASNLSAPSQRDRLLPNGYQLPNNANASSAPTTETENYLRMGVAE